MSNNNVICMICAERIRNSDNIHAGSCGHAFHEECLFRWREESRTCPICRSKDADYFQLYLSFENDVPAGGGEGGTGRNQSQDNTSRSSSSPSNSASSSSSNSSSNSAGNSNSSTSSSSTSTSTSSNNNRGSTRDLSTGFMREYEILLYEKDLYQKEIEYLNHRIEHLTLCHSHRNCRLAEAESSTDSD